MTSSYEFNSEIAGALIEEVAARSGQDISSCYQCRRCAAGCPVAEETGFFTPDRLIRSIVLGDRQNTLSNPLIWKCVSCYTCGTRCPNDIQTGRITETIKKMAKEEHLPPLEPKVDNFHSAFVQSGVRRGRLNEIEFIGLYEFKNSLGDIKQKRFKELYNEVANQAKLGVSMLKKKRLHFGFQSARGRDEIKRLLQKEKNKQSGG